MANDKFLNYTGLSYYHGRLKTIFAGKDEVPTEEEIKSLADSQIAESLASSAKNSAASKQYVEDNGGKIDVIKVNGTAQTITNKEVDIPVPTKTSDITNDNDYQNEDEVQALIDAALADITGIDYRVVASLPATGEKGVIYLVQNSSGDGYDEYIWITPTGGTARFEKIGSTDVDLSGYWAKTELTAITTAEIDTIIA